MTHSMAPPSGRVINDMGRNVALVLSLVDRVPEYVPGYKRCPSRVWHARSDGPATLRFDTWSMAFDPSPPPAAIFMVTAWLNADTVVARVRLTQPDRWDAPPIERAVAGRDVLVEQFRSWLDAVAAATPG